MRLHYIIFLSQEVLARRLLFIWYHLSHIAFLAGGSSMYQVDASITREILSFWQSLLVVLLDDALAVRIRLACSLDSLIVLLSRWQTNASNETIVR